MLLKYKVGHYSLVDVNYVKHYMIKHNQYEFVILKSPIKGINLFWSFIKYRLTKFNIIPKYLFYLNMKEYKFHF